MDSPNVIIFCSDEHARSWTSCYGHEHVQTPTLDKLSNRGTTFSRAVTPSPICVSARASLATGLQVHETRCWSSAEPYYGQHESWMHRVRDRGCMVMSVGKLHFRSCEDDNGFTEEILPMHVSNNGIGWPQSLLRNPLPAFEETRELAEQTGPGESEYTEYDRRITDAASNWLRMHAPRTKSKPWVLFVSFASPHYPFRAPSQFYNLYDRRKLFLPNSEFENKVIEKLDHPVLNEIRRFWNYDDYFDDNLRLEAKLCYFGLVSFLDNNIGRVLGALEDSGCMQDTVILYTSDHGEMLGHFGFWGKSVMYENSVGIPLIAAGPGFKPQRCNVPVSLTDIGATVEYAIGMETSHSESWRPKALQKVSSRTDKGRFVLSQYHDGGTPVSYYMIRQEDWKYVYYAGGYRPQLFNLAEEPFGALELNDLGGDLAHRERWSSMHTNLLQIMNPNEIAEQCASDQAARINSLGGREAVLAMNSFNHTPVSPINS